MTEQSQKKLRRTRRVNRIAMKIRGNSVKPRLVVTRTNRHVYAQIIDDVLKKTLVSASDLKNSSEKKSPTRSESAIKIGKILAQKAVEKKIHQVIFDRRWYKYHGVIKSLADSARSNGLKF